MFEPFKSLKFVKNSVTLLLASTTVPVTVGIGILVTEGKAKVIVWIGVLLAFEFVFIKVAVINPADPDALDKLIVPPLGKSA